MHDAFADAKRLCYAGLDSLRLREELARRLAPATDCDAFSFGIADPEFGVLTHAVAQGIPEGCHREFVTHIYPEEEATKLLDQASAGEVLVPARGDALEAARRWGFGNDLRLLLTSHDTLWGVLCLFRGLDRPDFDARQRELLLRLAPHVSRALRQAVLREVRATAEAREDVGGGPGVVVYDRHGQCLMREANAACYLADLADVHGGRPTERIPSVVAGALARLRWAHARRDACRDALPLDVQLTVRGRSRRLYAVHAALAEPDPQGAVLAMVVLTPARAAERTGLLAIGYGLSPREREVLSRLARGETTKQIASALRLSCYTVQDFIDAACEKVGVRGRKALLARLFSEHLAERAGAAKH